MSKTNYHLFIDDSGSRKPDHVPQPARTDGMDYFALGGFLIKEIDIPILIERHRALCEKWKIDYQRPKQDGLIHPNNFGDCRVAAIMKSHTYASCVKSWPA
jgi:hypothetical protein